MVYPDLTSSCREVRSAGICRYAISDHIWTAVSGQKHNIPYLFWGYRTTKNEQGKYYSRFRWILPPTGKESSKSTCFYFPQHVHQFSATRWFSTEHLEKQEYHCSEMFVASLQALAGWIASTSHGCRWTEGWLMITAVSVANTTHGHKVCSDLSKATDQDSAFHECFYFSVLKC